jgi:hypothetical protein
MLTPNEQDAANKARGASQAAAENLKYQAKKNAGAPPVSDKLAKFLKTQRGANKKK